MDEALVVFLFGLLTGSVGGVEEVLKGCVEGNGKELEELELE